MEWADGAALPDITLRISLLVKSGVYLMVPFKGRNLTLFILKISLYNGQATTNLKCVNKLYLQVEFLVHCDLRFIII